MTKRILQWVSAGCVLGACVALASFMQASAEPIRPIPTNGVFHADKVALGRMLFHDERLSKDNSVSCASCHDLASGGDDGRRVSVGVDNAEGPINAPTVFNTGFNFKQFWDGRAETLEDQTDGPVQSAIEMASLWPDIVAKLYQDESARRCSTRSTPTASTARTSRTRWRSSCAPRQRRTAASTNGSTATRRP